MSGLLMVALASMAQPGVPVVDGETRCNYMVSREGRVLRMDQPEIHVVSQTAGEGPFAPGIPAGSAIRCGRSDIVPAANDWKVIAAGYPFVITEVTLEHDARIAILEMVNGQVGYRFLTGRIREGEAPRIQARLEAFQRLLQVRTEPRP
jgi:hypothetical protein